MAEPVPTSSVSFRLQRTTTEFTFVSVPVTADLIVEQPDGTGRIDVPRLVQRAVELGQTVEVEWHTEGQEVQPHPVQTPPPGLGDNPRDAEPNPDDGHRHG
jgi:hypothetical protein